MPGKERCFLMYLQDCDLSREAMREVYARIREEGTADTVFYDGTVTNENEFVAEVLRPGSLPFLVFWEGKEAGLAWFNDIEGRSARGHFVFFREFWGHKISAAIGRKIFSHILTLRDERGYLLDVLLGKLPARNCLAWRLGLLCGAREVGTIPNGVYMAGSGKSENAKLAAVTRETLGLAEGLT